ncbi:putative AC9 transposase [Bienertia sinuspersici]
MQNALGRIYFTSDNWRNDSAQYEYICITAYLMDKNWKLQKRIIRFGALTPPFDGITLVEDVCLCLEKWKIVSKLGYFTLDNATCNNIMVTFFQIHYCFHIINLIVQAGLRLIDDVVEKIRAWLSTYLMLDHAPYFRAAIDHMMDKDIEIKMYLLDDDEWNKLLVIHDFLKVILSSLMDSLLLQHQHQMFMTRGFGIFNAC